MAWDLAGAELSSDSYLKNQCVGAVGDKIFYSDDDHLSIEGSRLLAEEIIKKLDLDD